MLGAVGLNRVKGASRARAGGDRPSRCHQTRCTASSGRGRPGRSSWPAMAALHREAQSAVLRGRPEQEIVGRAELTGAGLVVVAGRPYEAPTPLGAAASATSRAS